MAETARLIEASSNIVLYLLLFEKATHGLIRCSFQEWTSQHGTKEKRDGEKLWFYIPFYFFQKPRGRVCEGDHDQPGLYLCVVLRRMQNIAELCQARMHIRSLV